MIDIANRLKNIRVVHPLLLAVFPIIFLYDHNLAEVPRDQIVLPLLMAAAGAAALWAAAWLALRNSAKSGLIVSLVLTLFFTFGHVARALGKLNAGAWAQTGLPWLWLALLALGAALIYKTNKTLRDLTNFLNVAAVAMVAISIYSIVATTANTNKILKEIGLGEQPARAAPVKPAADNGDLPDIYYIILDSYPSRRNLKENYDFDNSEFVDYLTGRGFYVAGKSRSNYAQTYLSLSSSLNMEYINFLTDKVGPTARSTAVPGRLIKNNKVISYLRSRGYKTIHFRSGWSGTDRNEFADIQIDYGAGDEFAMMLLETTALRSVQGRLGLVKAQARERILSMFRNLKKIPKRPGPTFTFVHFVPPHPPYFFGAHGEEVERPKLKMSGYVWKEKEKYLGQIVFVNNQMKAVIDRILADSDKPPIIVIQADHGSASTFYTEKKGSWRRPTPVQLRERMRILNAYYLPGADYSGLRPDITPVNSWRLIFNKFLGGDFKQLNDVSYYSDYMVPYVFSDVTPVVSE